MTTDVCMFFDAVSVVMSTVVMVLIFFSADVRTMIAERQGWLIDHRDHRYSSDAAQGGTY